MAKDKKEVVAELESATNVLRQALGAGTLDSSKELDKPPARKELPAPKKDIPNIDKEARLQSSMERLSLSINSLVEILNNAEKGIKTEAALEDKTVSEKIDLLVSHNEEMARALLLLLELNREHLPKISKHTKISSDSAEKADKQKMQPQMPQPIQAPQFMSSSLPKMSIPEIELPPLDIEPSQASQAPKPLGPMSRPQKKKFFGFGK